MGCTVNPVNKLLLQTAHVSRLDEVVCAGRDSIVYSSFKIEEAHGKAAKRHDPNLPASTHNVLLK